MGGITTGILSVFQGFIRKQSIVQMGLSNEYGIGFLSVLKLSC